MKIGLVSDIHGNQQTLTKVLGQLYAERVDLILCAGDLVCYGAHCNQVIALIRSCAIPCVAGNYDAAVAWDWPSASSKPSSPANEVLKQVALGCTKRYLHSKHRDSLHGLPWMLSYRLDEVEDAPSCRTIVINPGAVGRSLYGDTRAAYAICQTDKREGHLAHE